MSTPIDQQLTILENLIRQALRRLDALEEHVYQPTPQIGEEDMD